ncbi:SRPBCC family protein [Amycolatopsis tucumanensis]|uniref:SRPBCC family protein n=1 Tax=Amycolatopsis tucumanensis TaxID=401106 RepID=UPI003D75C275
MKHPPEKVWRALSEPGELAAWFPGARARLPSARGRLRGGAWLRLVCKAASTSATTRNGRVGAADALTPFARCSPARRPRRLACRS